MWKFIKKIFYYLALISIFSIVWGRFFNPIITITQIEGLVKYQKLDRDYISYDEMGKDVKKMNFNFLFTPTPGVLPQPYLAS